MADENEEPITQECFACGALIDVTAEPPLAFVHCPGCGAAMRARTEFEHFQLLEVLGSGGMGSVYRALDTRLNRPVALKLLRPEHMENPEILAQFEREAEITASIVHPHVVKVYSTGLDHGIFYMAMELVDKGSLDDLINLQGKIAEMQVLEVGIQIAQGLDAAARCGLIHRDVKPGNILFSEAHTAKIVDFGLAAITGQAIEVGGEVWGTPYYVAPEKLEPQPAEDFRSDLYSLGSSLFHAIAGRPPYEADEASILALRQIKSTPVSLHAAAPNVSSATAFVIDRMLLKNPDERYPSYEELIEHLRYARTELMKATEDPRDPRTHVQAAIVVPEKKLSWFTFAIVALLAAGGVAAFEFRDRLFPPQKVANPSATPAPAVPIESRYEEARKTLLAGDAPAAAAAFRALDADTVRQPMRNWITLHAGLAHLLAGQPGESSADFRKLGERERFSEDPAEEKLANYFTECGRALGGEETIAAPAATDDHGTLGLLLYALKNWTRGAIDEAGPMLRAFAAAAPAGHTAWIADYQPLAAPYLADFAAYRAALDLPTPAALAEKKGTLEALKAAREKLRLKSEAVARLEARETKLAGEIAAEEEAMAQKIAAQDAADAARFGAAQARVAAFFRALQFPEAARAAADADAPPAGEKWKPQFALLRKKGEWAVAFKRTLLQDLNTTGFTGNLPINRTGPVSIRHADDTRVDVIVPFGKSTRPWTDLGTESMILLGRSFLRQGMRADQLGDRQWLLGIFSLLAGHRPEAQPLLEAGSRARPEYGDALPLLIAP